MNPWPCGLGETFEPAPLGNNSVPKHRSSALRGTPPDWVVATGNGTGEVTQTGGLTTSWQPTL